MVKKRQCERLRKGSGKVEEQQWQVKERSRKGSERSRKGSERCRRNRSHGPDPSHFARRAQLVVVQALDAFPVDLFVVLADRPDVRAEQKPNVNVLDSTHGKGGVISCEGRVEAHEAKTVCP